MIDVLSCASGNPYLDVIFGGLPHMPAPGEEVMATDLAFVPGGSLTSAIVLTRLGCRVLYEAQLGADFASRFLLEAMRREGMSEEAIRLAPDGRACVTVAVNQHGDRSFLSYAYPSPPPDPTLVDRYQPRAVMIDGLRLGEEVLETLRRAKRLGALRVADVQDLAPTLAEPGAAELLSLLDMVTLNEREARQLTGCATLEAALDVLTALAPLVVLKKGARGATAIAPFGRVELPAFPVEAVDLTGCGDNFFAAFVAAMLDGRSLPECLAWANAAGALAAGALGGVSRAYAAADLQALAAQRYGEFSAPAPPWGVTWDVEGK